MIGRVLFCLLWFSTACAAQGMPAFYDVVDVATDDVLNLREAPDARSEVLGFLAADARAVEVVQINDDGTWGLISRGESGGWASLRYLARQPGQSLDALPQNLRCGGTEPFWSLSIAEQQIEFSQFSADSLTFGAVKRMPSSNRTDRWALIAKATGADITAITTTDICSDGMSDRIYGLTLDLVITGGAGTTAYSGCCSLTTP